MGPEQINELVQYGIGFLLVILVIAFIVGLFTLLIAGKRADVDMRRLFRKYLEEKNEEE